jgi:hypothetical protein
MMKKRWRGMRLRGFFNDLDEELKAKDGEVDAGEGSSEGEGRKRKRAEDFGGSFEFAR